MPYLIGFWLFILVCLAYSVLTDERRAVRMDSLGVIAIMVGFVAIGAVTIEGARFLRWVGIEQTHLYAQAIVGVFGTILLAFIAYHWWSQGRRLS